MARSATRAPARAAAPLPAAAVLPLRRTSPLDGVARPGRYGAHRAGGPGVVLSCRHPLSMVWLAASRGQARAFAAALGSGFGLAVPGPGKSTAADGLVLQWAGEDQYLAVAAGLPDGVLHDRLRAALAGRGAVVDQSHGRVVLAVSGPRCRDLLAKGSPVDLHPRAFQVGDVAMTSMAHIGVHIARTGPDDFELSLFRAFAADFWSWLSEMALEFGYEVR